MPSNKHSATSALVAMASVVITAFVVAALYIGRDVLIPIALATLLAFLLAPLVTRLERWIGRVAAALLAVAILFGVLGGVGWVLTRQVLDLAERLPDYEENIKGKLHALKMPGGGRFTKLSATVEELKKELPGAETPSGETTVAAPPGLVAGGLPQPPASNQKPVPVEVVETKSAGPASMIGAILTPVIGPLGTGALVLLLLICILLQREDLRGRIMRVIGKGNISATTRALDDAAGRVARYLLMQLIVNATYGVAVALGLWWIGVPSPFVWGVLATVLRFIPYVGPWIAAAFPIALSLAVTDNWTMPLLTIGMFVVLELLSNNVMEPLLYGSSTGVSSIALIIAAVFWTWLWGAAGLVLATPLTVCMVVMGRHVPRLGALAVLLSDEEALKPHEEFYHRLLTPNANDGSEFAEQYLKAHSRLELYENVCLPVLAAVGRDCHRDELDDDEHDEIMQELREIVDDLGTRPDPEVKADAKGAAETAVAREPAPICRVHCLPARADRDEIAGLMLGQLLAAAEFPVHTVSAKLASGEMIEIVEKDGAEAVCVSVVEPSTVVHARYLCGKLRARFPELHVVVGLWGLGEEFKEASGRLRGAGANEIVGTLADAVAALSKHAAELAREAVLLAPQAANESERLAELKRFGLLDSAADPVLDRLTRKVARILDVPVALITLLDEKRQFFLSQTGLPEALARARETPRELSVCEQVAATEEMVVIEDLARDRRFAQNALLREHGWRFYAGAPLRTPRSHVIGSLCVMDTKPRRVAEHEKRLLQVTAEEVMEALLARETAVAVAPVATTV